jgi:hypothetical protein
MDSLETESYRISCYHCSQKFNKMKEYREHHLKQHQRLVMRCFRKDSKSSSIKK